MNVRLPDPRHLLALTLLAAPHAMADEPVSSVPNDCSTVGRLQPCASDDDCASFTFATACIKRDGAQVCEAPCTAASATDPGKDGVLPDPAACSLGETCTEALSGGGSDKAWYCKPTQFRMNLNLLDMCINHFLNRTQPVESTNGCALQANLNSLLEQNGDGEFNVFDLDLCVLAFVEQRGCRVNSSGERIAMEADVVCCDPSDTDSAICGRGAYCDETLQICQRDCGQVASREDSIGNAQGTLEYTCQGNLQICDEYEGRCVSVDPSVSTCQVDSDCTPGAYCLLGRCAANCYRATDCPDSGWYCTKNNKCRALPPAAANEGFVFDPSQYAIRFARDEMRLDAIQVFDSSELAIMDLITKRQVLGNSSIAFGYRMEITYGVKQDAACLKPFVDCTDAAQRSDGESEVACERRQDDCLIDVSEQWIRPVAPFGTINAAGRTTLPIALEESIVDRLSPGTYPATVRLIFDNGDSDQIPVTFTKKSPSGEYAGNLTVYMGIVENALNSNRPLTLTMRIKVYPEQNRQWNQLMVAHKLNIDDEGFVDLTQGQLVHASLHGEDSLAFTRGEASTTVPDEVQFVGIYVPESQQLRLVGIIDIDKNFEMDADGGDCDNTAALCARNLFNRNIRRRIEFNGPFDDATGLYHGIYRETIFGLVPDDGLTLDGGFQLSQQSQDDSDLPVDAPLGTSKAVEFTTLAASDLKVSQYCDAVPTSVPALATLPEVVQAYGFTIWNVAVEVSDAAVTDVDMGTSFDVTFDYAGTGAGYQHIIVGIDGEPQRCVDVGDTSTGTISGSTTVTLTAPGIPGVHTVRFAPSVVASSSDGCDMDDWHRIGTLAANGGVGCSDGAVTACVCAQDTYCCTVEWDAQCASEVQGFGCGACGAGIGSSGDLTGGPGSESDIANFRVNDLLALAKSDFPTYMAASRRGGVGTPDNPFGRVTIFPDLVDFRQAIEFALGALDVDNFASTSGDPTDIEATDNQVQQAHLNIYDFLDEWVVPCSVDVAQPPPGCIDENKLRCGLALHQRALIQEQINVDAVESASGHPPGVAPDVFCEDTLPTEGCPEEAVTKNSSGVITADYRHLFAMQEHNRYWRNLAQTLKYQGDRAQSDAFMVLFRNEVNPFVQGTAISYKIDQLRNAISSYDEAVKLIIDRAATTTLFNWPARSFKQVGNDWLVIMQSIVSDRMDALRELVDLERRVSAQTDEADYRYAHHLMQQEYLIQVYIMVLQSRWQGEIFAYRGEAGPILERGQEVLNQLNPAKNEIGVTSNLVFFENGNTDPDIHNWENYRQILVGDDGDGGLLGSSRDTVNDAVEQMQNALADLDSFEESLQEARFGYQDTLNEVCGDPNPGNQASFDADSYCQLMLKKYDDADDWIALRDCKFADADDGTLTSASTDGTNPSTWTCPTGTEWACGGDNCKSKTDDKSCSTGDLDDTCRTVVKEFIAGTDAIEPYVGDGTGTGTATDPQGNIINNPPRCGFEGLEHMVSISVQGVQRPCVGGAIGTAFADKALLDRQRRIVIGSVETLMKQIQQDLELRAYKSAKNQSLLVINAIMTITQFVLDTASATVGAFKDSAEELPEGAKCVLIAGLAAGTDCPQKIAGAIGKSSIVATLGLVQVILDEIGAGLGIINDLLQKKGELAIDNEESYTEVVKAIRDADSLIDEYNALTQESFNKLLEINSLRYQAQAAADRFAEEVLFTAEHLIGRESGNILKGESLARDASSSFRDIILFTYKMTQAFTHHFNSPPGDRAQLLNEALTLVTLDDVASFVGKLDDRVRDYCGLEGIDCDSHTNSEVLRYSLRERAFPGLRDIVDARTGKVLTAGEQFHNKITAPPFLKRRFRGAEAVDQIEVNIPLPLTELENTPTGPRWLIDPLSCNHKLEGVKTNDSSGVDLGTLAVNVIGQNLPDATGAMHYQLIRGPVDYVRGCHEESVQKEIGLLPVLQYPIRTWTVGYAPQHPSSDQNSPPAYTVRTSTFRSCMNFEEMSGTLEAAPCWRYFARDRTLAQLDSKIVIPLQVGKAATDNYWIPGEGLPDEQRPIIEDIVIHYRYRSRPLQED